MTYRWPRELDVHNFCFRDCGAALPDFYVLLPEPLPPFLFEKRPDAFFVVQYNKTAFSQHESADSTTLFARALLRSTVITTLFA